MSETALRFNNGKPQLGYILYFPKAVEALSRILEYGASKYEDMNWKKGGKPDKEYIDAAMRHLTKWLNNGPFDDESGCSHLMQVVWNLLVLFEVNHPDQVVNFSKFEEAIKYWAEVKNGRTASTHAVQANKSEAPERESSVCD